MRLHRCAEIGCRELIKNGWSNCEKHYGSRIDKYVRAKQVSFDQKARTLRGQYESTKAYDTTRRQKLHDGFYTSKKWDKITMLSNVMDMWTPLRISCGIGGLDCRPYYT